MAKRPKPTFKVSAKFEDQAAFEALSHDICKRWKVSEYPNIKNAVFVSLIELNAIVHVFLKEVQEIESNTPVRLSDHAVPPRIFYERIDEERKRLHDNPEALDALNRLDEIESKKLTATIVVIDRIKSAVEKNLPQEFFEGRTLEQGAFKIAGSSIRGIINLSMEKYKAEINFCKNPSVKIAGKSDSGPVLVHNS